jgi:aspartate aminotransferase
VFHGLGCPGDEFVVSAPYFPEYKVFIEGAGCAMKLAAPQPGSLQLDPAALEKAIGPHTKGLVVNSPNNPSGVIYTKETLEAVASLLERKSAEYGHPIYLIADEPYREIVFEGCSVPWLPHIYRNTIVCYSFSKSLSLPGERIGYVFVPKTCADHDDVYAAVAGAGRMLGYVCAPSLFQRVAAACCSLTSDTSVYARNAKLLVTSLRAMGYDCVEPQGAFYLFLKTLEPDDLAFSERAKGHDLLLVPGSGFGMKGYVRLAFCVQTEMIERAMPKFQALADSYR